MFPRMTHVGSALQRDGAGWCCPVRLKTTSQLFPVGCKWPWTLPIQLEDHRLSWSWPPPWLHSSRMAWASMKPLQRPSKETSNANRASQLLPTMSKDLLVGQTSHWFISWANLASSLVAPCYWEVTFSMLWHTLISKSVAKSFPWWEWVFGPPCWPTHKNLKMGLPKCLARLTLRNSKAMGALRRPRKLRPCWPKLGKHTCRWCPPIARWSSTTPSALERLQWGLCFSSLRSKRCPRKPSHGTPCMTF